jgi:exo-beta-1,3-glucanase (GH17 family)/cellulose synthase/poly-beta-1,6-N-acetylglucosamine synthase-like glycosyltransferase
MTKSSIHTALAVGLTIALANLLAWGELDRAYEPAPWTQVINGVSFSPYRADQDPLAGRHPTPEQIDADLAVLAGAVKQVRTYSATDGLEAVAPLANRHGLLVTAGAWIDGRPERNRREIDGVVRMARDNANVTRVLVGNEALLRQDVSLPELIDAIRQVRTQVKVPVSTAEPWHIWLSNPALGREVDYIAVHILPYWEGLAVEDAVDYVMARYQQVKDAYPTKPVVLTEVGWPSAGRLRRDAQPSAAGQAIFLREFLTAAAARGLDYYVMEAFDQPWKRRIEGHVGPYWGLLDADRLPKFAMTGAVRVMPNWPALAMIATLLALAPMAWFLRRWRDLNLGGQLFGAGLMQGAASVWVYVSHAGLTHYMTLGTALMWVVLLPLLALLLALLLLEGVEFAEVVWSNGRKRAFPVFAPNRERAWPKVSIHVPMYNEPPDMVRRTLDALARLDYPNFEVIVVDNNTKDEAVWRPVEAHCLGLGARFRFFHVAPLAGFKAGALNFALRHTAPDAAIVGVIDSDYTVLPDWLTGVVPHFDRPEVGFVQAPQDHDDWRDDRFKEMINWEYAGFFQIGMIQRNERDAIIQHGTMTLIRRAALDQVGDWAEWCICEDSEMGLRLLAGGWQSVYTDRRFGYGVTPDHFTGYRTQRFRWAYGAVQILKRHWRSLLPRGAGRLNPMQRYHFVTGWMPWFADALGVVLSLAGLAWTAGALLAPRYFDFPLTLFLVPALAVFAVKIGQFLLLYKLRVGCSLRQRLGAGLAGLSLTYTIGKAVIYGLFTDKLPFVRTPKCEGHPALFQAAAMAREEIVIALLLWLAAATVARLHGVDDPESLWWSALLLAQSLPFAAAAAVAFVSALPRRQPVRPTLAPLPAPAGGE